MSLELTLLDSVRAFAAENNEKLERLDILLHSSTDLMYSHRIITISAYLIMANIISHLSEKHVNFEAYVANHFWTYCI